MLEITVDKFKELVEALDKYIKVKILPHKSPPSGFYCVPFYMRSKWKRRYRNNKYLALIQIILHKYSEVKVIGKNEITITKEASPLYRAVYKHSSMY